MQKRDGHESDDHGADAHQADAETEPTANVPAEQIKPPASLALGGGVAGIVPKDIDGAWRLATIFAEAGTAPKSYANDKNKIMVGIMHGLEVGLTPLVALQSIAVINQVPTIWGDGLLALVQSSGLLHDISETVETDGEGNITAAVCTAIRPDRPTPIVGRFSMQDAITAELTNKPGPWKQYPRRMLQMRARAFCLRDGFPDVLKGLSVAEEMRDVETLEQGADGVHRAVPSRAEFAEAVKESGLTDEQAAEGNAELDDNFANTMGAAEAEQATTAQESPAQSTESATTAQEPDEACDPVPHLRAQPTGAELKAWRNDMFDSIKSAPSIGALDALLRSHAAAIQYLYQRYPGTDKTNMLDAIAERRDDFSGGQ